jgi:hypothetical protein
VVVLLNWEGFEAPLPDMAAAAVALAITMHVSGQQPLHPRAQVVIATRPHDQMEMVGHQAKAHEPHRHPRTSLLEQPHERVMIVGIVEDLGPAVAAVEDMVAIATHRSSCCPRHARIVVGFGRPGK